MDDNTFLYTELNHKIRPQ